MLFYNVNMFLQYPIHKSPAVLAGARALEIDVRENNGPSDQRLGVLVRSTVNSSMRSVKQENIVHRAALREIFSLDHLSIAKSPSAYYNGQMSFAMKPNPAERRIR